MTNFEVLVDATIHSQYGVLIRCDNKWVSIERSIDLGGWEGKKGIPQQPII
jgi:hypothetical protein